MSKKMFSICSQCIAKAKVPALNEVEVGEIANCSVCGKYGFMRQLDMGNQLLLIAGQRAEKKRKAERVAKFQAEKAEKALQAEKEKAEKVARRKPIKLRSITL